MRPIICDICGKMMKRETAFDENGHTTDDGYVNIAFRETRDHSGEYDICIDCYGKILNYVNNLKHQNEPK